MCGRYGLHHNPAEVVEQFGVHRLPEDLEAEDFERYNVAPTQCMPVVTERDGERTLERMRWGLVPAWAKDLKIGSRMINACGETAAEKPAFRHAFRKRRCLVPASGFYEWLKLEDGKQPLWIHREDGRPFAMAGLWEEWRGPDGPLRSYTVVTTTANTLMEPIHNRMPVILTDEDADRWLDPRTDAADLQALLRPTLPKGWTADPVNRAMNKVTFEGPECLEPA